MLGRDSLGQEQIVFHGLPNRTGNLFLLSLWIVSDRKASLPVQFISPSTGPFCKSFLLVKSYSPVLFGPLISRLWV